LATGKKWALCSGGTVRKRKSKIFTKIYKKKFFLIISKKFDVLDYNTLSMYDIISHFYPIGTLELKTKWI